MKYIDKYLDWLTRPYDWTDIVLLTVDTILVILLWRYGA